MTDPNVYARISINMPITTDEHAGEVAQELIQKLSGTLSPQRSITKSLSELADEKKNKRPGHGDGEAAVAEFRGMYCAPDDLIPVFTTRRLPIVYDRFLDGRVDDALRKIAKGLDVPLSVMGLDDTEDADVPVEEWTLRND